MVNSTGVSAWDQGIVSSADVLRRSLQSVLSGSVCYEAQAHAASLNTARWKVRNAAKASSALPVSLQRHLCEALDAAPGTGDDLTSIREALRRLLPHVTWTNRQARADQDSAFVDRHRHGIIAGPGGLLECSSLTLGLAIMMPETCYPYHQHSPAEFYLVLSPGDWYREGAGWWSPGAGGLVFNPPSCVHAMKSRDAPLLALWGLMH